MGYLICKECSGYYKLKTGESALDFNKCECGGKLKYSPGFKEKRRVEIAKDNGGVSLFLNTNKTIQQKTYQDPRLIRIFVGISLILIPIFLIPSNIFTVILASLAGGLVSSLFIKGENILGVANGARVGIFSLIIYLAVAFTLSIFFNNNLLLPGSFNLGDLYVLIFAALLLIFSTLGGLMGIICRRQLDKPPQKEEIIFREEEITVKDPDMEWYHEDMVNIGYLKVKAINDAEQVFKDLLAGNICETEALESLQEDKKIIDQVCYQMKQIEPPEKYNNYHQLKVSATEDISKTFHIIDGLVLTDSDKIQKTDSLVDQSTNKIYQAISEFHKNMQYEGYYE